MSLDASIESICSVICSEPRLAHDDLYDRIDELVASSDIEFPMLFEEIDSCAENLCARSGNDCYYDDLYKRRRMFTFYRILGDPYTLCDVCYDNSFWDNDLESRDSGTWEGLKCRIFQRVRLQQTRGIKK